MSWQGYMQWLEHRRELLEQKKAGSPPWAARDLAERTLFSLQRTETLAQSNGSHGRWQELRSFFLQSLEELESKEDSDTENHLFQARRAAWDEEGTDSAQLEFDRGYKLAKSGKAGEAFDALRRAYNLGHKDYASVKRIIQVMEDLSQPEETADFISRTMLDNEYGPQQLAELYFLQGKAYLASGKHNQARQALWHVRKLQPEYPGLEEKLQQLEKTRKRAKSKYDLLLEQGKVTSEQMDQARKSAAKSGKDLDAILVDELKVAKKDLGRSLSAFYDAPFVSFDPKAEPPYEIFEKRRLDPEFLKRYGWVPYRQEGKSIEVLMSNPFDLGKIDEIRFILGTSRIEPKVALKQDIDAFIDAFFQALSGGEELTEFDEEVDADSSEEDDSVADLEEAVSEEDSEVVRLVNALMVEAWKRGASDIHIEPNSVSRNCSVRFRVDGTCHEFRKLRYSLSRPIVSRIKIMSRLDIAERRLPQDGKVKLRLPQVNKVIEFRVATMPTLDNQEDVVLRLLASGKPLPLEKLGLDERNQQQFKKNIYQPYGMVLVVGPTGSGKTTTLHSALHYINTPEKKIWTAEDPVEITQEGLRQVQINSKIGLSFASALRSFLRADPDVIMIGEMRDKETAHIGVEASLTGHLVFSTLHTNSAPETITRLLDMEMDPFNFADSLLCVLAQRLVKTLCPHCKEPYKPGSQELEEIMAEFGPESEWAIDKGFLSQPRLYRTKGCRHCLEGYRGRVGIHELLLNSDAIKNLIKYKKTTEDLRRQAKEEGMLSLKQDGILKVLQGITDLHQVRAVAG